MAQLPPLLDPTLEAADRALEEHEARRPRRKYLGMSAIGDACSRKLWYGFHGASGGARRHDAATLKRFADGHASEAIMADRLRLVPGIELHTLDPNGNQWGFSDHDGRFRGHMDGAIRGLIQAPKTWHVWEHKCVGEKKQAELTKLKADKGEKAALKAWNPVYYAQGVLYMHYSGMERHYLTVSSPGTRTTISCRTEADPIHAAELINKAERIINARAPLAKVSEDPAWFQCRMCEYAAACHGKEPT